MSNGTTKAPNLPIAPIEYDQQWQDNFSNALRLYFSQLDNPGPTLVATQRNGTKLRAALGFSQPDPTNPSVRVLSIPSQADLAYLRVGDVYYDATAGNVLKVKT